MGKKFKHGALVGHVNRWCEAHGHEHGPLYICEHYPKRLRAEIAEKNKQFRANVKSRAWWKKQAEENEWDKETLAIAMICYGHPTED